MKQKISALFMVLLMLLLPVDFALALDDAYGGGGTVGSTTSSSSGDFPEYANSNNFGFAGTTSADSIIELYVNDIAYTSTISDSTGAYEFKRVLLGSSGTSTITLKITNTADASVSTESFNVIVDNTFPAFSGLSSVPTTYQESSLTISGSVSEESTIVISVNGDENEVATSATSFSESISLDDGDNNVILTAIDRAGNTASTSYSIFVDTTAPQILSNNLADLSPTYSREITVRGKVSENATVRITVDGAGNSLYQCSDGIDNDGDGLIDYPNDPGCDSPTDMIEQDASDLDFKACSDGIDNDGDGLKDFGEDLGCDSPSDNDETNWNGTSQCNDGIDNDNDGRIDFNPKGGGDWGCSGLQDNDESDDADIGNVYITNTDSEGFFTQKVDLGYDITTSFSTSNTIRVDGSSDSFGLNFDNNSGREHTVKITAIDSVGLTDEVEDTVRYSSCSSGSGDFLIFQGQIFPGALIPDHIFQGIAQISFNLELTYIGNGEDPEDVQLFFGTRELSNEDEDDWDMNIFDPTRCSAMPDSTGLNWYVTCNLKRYPAEAYRNITASYEDFEEQEVLRLPINIEVHYTGEVQDYDGTSSTISKTQIVCYDMEYLLDKRVSPEDIPKDLLEDTVEFLENIIDAIDDILPFVQNARWITFAACFALSAWQWIGSLGEEAQCGVSSKFTNDPGVTSSEKLILERLVRGSDKAGNSVDESEISTFLGPFSASDEDQKKLGALKNCADVKSRIRGNQLRREAVCDRIFCPSVPSAQKYWQDAPKESPCYKDADPRLKSPSFVRSEQTTTETMSYCDVDYQNEWKYGCLAINPLKRSRELQQGPEGNQSGISNVLNKINGLSLCEFFENDENNGRTAYSTPGHSVIVDNSGGSTQYQLAYPVSAEDLDDDSKVTNADKYHNNANIEFRDANGNVIDSPSIYGDDADGTYVGSDGDCVFVKPNLEDGYDGSSSNLFNVMEEDNANDDDDVYKTVSLSEVGSGDVTRLNDAYGLTNTKYYTDRNGEIYYEQNGAMQQAPHYYVSQSFNSRTGQSQFTASTNNDNCYKSDLIRDNNAQEYLIDPTDGFINSVRCVCLPAIEGYLWGIKNILTAIKNCFESVLVTNEFDAGVCKAILTQYLCDFVFDLLGCLVRTFSFEGGEDRESTPVSRFFTDLSNGGERIKEQSQARYGKTAVFKALFNERQLIHAVCLAAFGYDWQPDLDAAMTIQGGGFSINSTGLVSPATRRFVSYNPNADGVATHIYHVGYFLTAGEDLNWQLELLCSSSYDCEVDNGFEAGRCDCAGGTFTEQATMGSGTSTDLGVGLAKTIDGGALTGGQSVGSGGGNPYGNSQGDLYVRLDDPVRYDKVRLSWTPRLGTEGHAGSVVVPIRQEGLNAPATCTFSLSLMKYSCGFTNSGDGSVYITDVKELRRNSVSDDDPGDEPFKKTEDIQYQVSYSYTTGDTDDEETPRYLRITIKDENGAQIQQMHTDDYSIQSGSRQTTLPYQPKSAEELVGGDEAKVKASSLTATGVSGSTDNNNDYVKGTLKSNEYLELDAQGSSETEYVVFFWKKQSGSGANIPLKYYYYTQSELTNSGSTISVKDKFAEDLDAGKSGASLNSITGNSLKYNYEDYILTVSDCNSDSDYCVAYFKLSSSSTSKTLDKRCEDNNGNNLKWSATFEFMDGNLVDGKAEYSARNSVSASPTTRPTEKTVDLVISCEGTSSSSDEDDELDTCAYDVYLTSPCVCGDKELTESKIDDGYKVCIPTEEITSRTKTYEVNRDLAKELRDCPTQTTAVGFISLGGSGKCYATTNTTCTDGEYYNTQLEECR